MYIGNLFISLFYVLDVRNFKNFDNKTIIIFHIAYSILFKHLHC